MDIFADLNLFGPKPAVVSTVIAETAPQQIQRETAPTAQPMARAPDAFDQATEIQDDAIAAGMSKRFALACALTVIAESRPMISGAVNGRARRLSAKRSRSLKAVAAQILIDEQGRQS